MKQMSENEIYEKLREKVFFFVSSQKRTEAEVRRTFLAIFKKHNIPREKYNLLMEELKEKGYINDKDYVRRKFTTYINLKKSSVKEIEYKILQKGVAKEVIDQYKEENEELLYRHEMETAKILYEKKISGKSEDEVKQFLIKKGYSEDVVRQL